MSNLIKNHYIDDELKRIRSEHELGLGQKLALPLESLNCVAVVLLDSKLPKEANYHLHKYFPFTLISANNEENGKTTWGVNKIKGATLDQVFQWLPNPK